MILSLLDLKLKFVEIHYGQNVKVGIASQRSVIFSPSQCPYNKTAARTPSLQHVGDGVADLGDLGWIYP